MPANRESIPAVARVQMVQAWLATAATAVIPLAVVPDLLDRFRVVKEFLMRSHAVLALFLLVAAVLLGGGERLREMLRERALVAVTAAGVAWALLTTALSTHRGHSVESLTSFLAGIIIFFATWYAAPKITLLLLDVLVPVTAVNTILCALQEYGLYQPFAFREEAIRHHTATGLIGNPNIVGSYMTLVTIILGAGAIAASGKRRWWYAAGAFSALSAVFVSRTRTAVIALLIGLALLALAMSAKRALVFAGVAMAILAVAYVANVRVVQRVAALPKRVAQSGLEVATSGRVTPALAALAMARDHPLTGVGPGAFKYQFLPYQLEVRGKHPRLHAVAATNFGEAHNDHLQMLAETGFPGYALFVAGLFLLIRRGRSAPEDDARGRIVRMMVVPLAATFAVLCLAQFPLHIAITRDLLVTIAGLTVGWARR